MNKIKKNEKGFTLVELLVVMAILGVLVALVAGNFRTAQIRGRDAKRKADLKQIANSLELFYADYGRYPAEASGSISACPYDPALSTGTTCGWGTDSMTDGKTVYFKTIPEDPTSSGSYLYRIVPSSSNRKFQLFARVENEQDPQIVTTPYTCGTAGLCNISITSSNTDETE
ncbi:prepilin-type N-terminal cleavage/methylation domain-containing protein [Candidatus Microgenomates bacterium]|nr:prepilin-type N-terminal cleavage/methylation domain-containing protein [Candidatus Microgenomates bacterium]